MTYIEFSKVLVELDLSIATFSQIVKISYKNLLSYKKKECVPNSIAALAVTFLEMKKNEIDYKSFIESLEFEYKKSNGSGFAKKRNLTEDERLIN